MDIPVTNNTAMPMYVGAYMVPPGETRLLPAHQVPEHLRPAAAEAPPAAPEDPVLALLAGSVAAVIRDLRTLGDPDLLRLREAETGGKARKSLLSALAEEELRRASLKTLEASLRDLPDEELAARRGASAEAPDELALIEALMLERGLPL